MTEVSVTARYIVDFIGGQSVTIEVGDREDLDIAIAEQYTAYGDVAVDMVYPEPGTPRIASHGFEPREYEA